MTPAHRLALPPKAMPGNIIDFLYSTNCHTDCIVSRVLSDLAIFISSGDQEGKTMGRYYESFDPPFFLDRISKFDAIKINPNAYERGDEAIIRDVISGLIRFGFTKRDDLIIKSHDQLVSLAGNVATLQIANFIASLTDRVLGVRGVDNKLMVKRAGAESALSPQRTQPTKASEAPPEKTKKTNEY